VAVKKLASLALAATLLAGCSGFNRNNEAAQISAINDKAAACRREVRDRPEIRPEVAALGSHNWQGEVPASELADDRLPTPRQTRAALALWDAGAPCRQAFVAAWKPDIGQIWSSFYAARASLVARFSKGNMTWGEYAQTVQALGIALDARLNEEVNRLNAEAQNRALTNAAIIGAMAPMLQPHSTQIVPFSCFGGPNYVSCH